MTLKNLLPFIQIIILSLLAYIVDKVVFCFYYPSIESIFKHSIETIFGFFLFCSLSILFLLIRVKKNNINSVGQTFLLVTSIKMALSYLLVRPILQSTAENVAVEKFNFLIVFTVFLTIETVVTIRILNNKQ
jgi:hypothetical protein